jgi:hypothetical protein
MSPFDFESYEDTEEYNDSSNNVITNNPNENSNDNPNDNHNNFHTLMNKNEFNNKVQKLFDVIIAFKNAELDIYDYKFLENATYDNFYKFIVTALKNRNKIIDSEVNNS